MTENMLPSAIRPEEWDELADVAVVREAWGLDEGERGQDLARFVYGARFDFISGGPGYIGDLFVLNGDAVGEPYVLIRDNDGQLKLA